MLPCKAYKLVNIGFSLQILTEIQNLETLIFLNICSSWHVIYVPSVFTVFATLSCACTIAFNSSDFGRIFWLLDLSIWIPIPHPVPIVDTVPKIPDILGWRLEHYIHDRVTAMPCSVYIMRHGHTFRVFRELPSLKVLDGVCKTEADMRPPVIDDEEPPASTCSIMQNAITPSGGFDGPKATITHSAVNTLILHVLPVKKGSQDIELCPSSNRVNCDGCTCNH